MARITSISGPEACDAGRRQASIEGVRTFYFDDGGETIFQLNTSGSTDRKFAGMTSQTLQFTEAAALDLIQCFKAAFPKIFETLD